MASSADAFAPRASMSARFRCSSADDPNPLRRRATSALLGGSHETAAVEPRVLAREVVRYVSHERFAGAVTAERVRERNEVLLGDLAETAERDEREPALETESLASSWH